jgi:two-component system sensor histidine kinase KdpD
VLKASTSASSRIDAVSDPARGRLTIFLGYAAGVGKTFQMLTLARDLQQRGIDVVVGYFEPHARPETMALAEGLETIPRKTIPYRGRLFEEMDAEAILARHPTVAVVDEFPHTNVPGSARSKRWEDVSVLLDAGIDVLTTMNVQHVESLNDEIWQSTGVRVRETVPDWIVKQADEVVLVDLTPQALLNRLERGVVYAPDRAQKALQHFFRESTLGALRELAMRQTALAVRSRVENQVQRVDRVDRVDQVGQVEQVGPVERVAPERLLLLVAADASSAALIRRGRRVADYLHAECAAVYVAKTPEMSELPRADRQSLERQLTFARRLRIETRVLVGSDVALTLVSFARVYQATQIFVSREERGGLRMMLGRGLIQRIVSLAPDMQVTIVANRGVRRRAVSS